MIKVTKAQNLSWLLALGVLGATSLPVSAQKDDKAQVRSLQQRVRSAEQAKAQLAQQKAELDGQVKVATDKLEATRRSGDAAERKRAALAKELDAAVAEKAELADKLAELERKLAESEGTLGDTYTNLNRTTQLLTRSEQANRQLNDTLGQRTQSLAECGTQNENLYQVGASLMSSLAGNGTGAPMEGEPVTGLARVALENKVEEYRDQLEQQRLAPLFAQEVAQRRAAKQLLDDQRAAQALADQRNQELERNQSAKLKEQSELDKMTRKLKSFFANTEW